MIDRDLVAVMVADGLNCAEIADRLHCSRPAVSRVVKRLGLELSPRRTVDVEALRQATAAGVSFSQFAKSSGFSLGSISRAAKQNGIDPPGTNHLEHQLPDGYHAEYLSGVSLYQLFKRSGIPINTLKRMLRRVDPSIKFRSG